MYKSDKWKWLALIPLLAIFLVFGPLAMSSTKPEEAARSSEGDWRRSGKREAPAVSPLKVVSSLAGVLLVAVGGIILLRRLQDKASMVGGNAIQIKETKRISPKRFLHVVRAGDQLLLLSNSEQGIHLVSNLTPSDAAPVELEAETEEEGAVPRDLVLTPMKPSRARPVTKKSPLGDFNDLMSKFAEQK